MLINCVVYQDGLKVADIPVQDISDWRDRPSAFVWVALKDPSPAEMLQMQEEFDLHPLSVEDAMHGHQRPKLEEYGETVFLVMHLLETHGNDPWSLGERAILVGQVAVFVGPNFVLSVRMNSQQTFLGVRERCEREPELLRLGAGFVFYALMDAVVDRYFPIFDRLEDQLERVEAQIFERKTPRETIRQLYEIRQEAAVVRHAVAPLLEAAGKLHGGRVPSVCASTQDYFRDVHDHLARLSGNVDAMRDTIASAMQVSLSLATIEESEVTKRLAAWAAIFAVSTGMAGIWGMNFENMPELKLEYGYYMALGLIASVGVGLWFWFRRKGWV